MTMYTTKGTAFWSHLQKANTKFTPRFCIDVILDKEEAEKLEDLGLPLREDDRGIFFCFKRNVENQKGKTQKKPLVVDSKKNIYNGDIGNGSIVRIQFRPFDWSFGGKKGTSADLVAVQVLELVEYGGEDVIILDEEEDGFETNIEENMINEDLFDED